MFELSDTSKARDSSTTHFFKIQNRNSFNRVCRWAQARYWGARDAPRVSRRTRLFVSQSKTWRTEGENQSLSVTWTAARRRRGESDGAVRATIPPPGDLRARHCRLRLAPLPAHRDSRLALLADSHHHAVQSMIHLCKHLTTKPPSY